MKGDRPLAAMAHALIGNVTNVVRIQALGATPCIVDGSTNPKPAGKPGPTSLGLSRQMFIDSLTPRVRR